MSQLILKKKRGGNNAKSLETRKRFLIAYEEFCGNVSAACAVAGISRRTYYRWMSSPTRTNEKFRNQLELVRPEERLKDLLENALIARVKDGSDSLIKFGLERLAADRGYGDSSSSASVSIVNVNNQQNERPLIEKVADACLAAMEKYAEQIRTQDDKWSVVQQFAKARNVDPMQLAERVGLTIETE